MSIAQSFENLNRSLRSISDQQRIKQQSEQQHEEKMLQIQDQINDPRRLLLREQAQAQLQQTAVVNPYDVSQGSTIDRSLYESKYRGRIQQLLPSDAELNNNGVIVFRGTDTAYTKPKWQQQELQNKLHASQATADLKVAQFNRDGMSAIKALKDYKKGIDTKTPALFQKEKIRELQLAVDDYNDIRNDPDAMAGKYMSDNESLNSGIIMNAQRPNPDPKLHTMLSSIRDANNSRINAIAKGAALKNIKSADFHRGVGKDMIHIKVPYRLGRDPGGSVEVGGEIYKRGRKTIIKDPAAGTGKEALRLSRRTQAVSRHTKLQNDINIAQAGLGREDTIQALLTEGSAKNTEDAEMMYKMLYKATDKFIANKEMQIYNFGLTYKDKPWFWQGREGARDQFDLIDATAKGKKLRPILKPTAGKKPGKNSGLTEKQLLSL